MPEQNQPDIEIYVKSKDPQFIKDWLEKHFAQSISFDKKGALITCLIRSNQALIPVNIMLKAQGDFSSIWFDSDETSWTDDLSCAQDFVKATQVEARCIKSSWAEDEQEDPDCWLQVSFDQTKEIIWK